MSTCELIILGTHASEVMEESLVYRRPVGRHKFAEIRRVTLGQNESRCALS